MPLTTCRECKKPVSADAAACPHCGAPRPAITAWKGPGYEWRSQMEIMGYPLIHIAFGRDQQGRRRVAKGVIAIGQFGIGLITVAQVGVGILFGFGQLMFGLTAVAQVAIAALFAVGQIAVGYAAIGQVAVGVYALAQVGVAEHLWTVEHRDPAAVEFFENPWDRIRTLFAAHGVREVPPTQPPPG